MTSWSLPDVDLGTVLIWSAVLLMALRRSEWFSSFFLRDTPHSMTRACTFLLVAGGILFAFKHPAAWETLLVMLLVAAAFAGVRSGGPLDALVALRTGQRSTTETRVDAPGATVVTKQTTTPGGSVAPAPRASGSTTVQQTSAGADVG